MRPGTAGDYFRQFIGFFSSIRTVLPVLLCVVLLTIIGGIFRDWDIFESGWYLTALGLLGFCLLCTTIDRIPRLLATNDKTRLLGVVLAHSGIIVLIIGMIFGGVSAFRQNIRIIEDEIAIVPELPFALKLEELVIEEYPDDVFSHIDSEVRPKKRQESRISVYIDGELRETLVSSPGNPVEVDGFTLLPSQMNTGWYFELLVTDRLGREKTIPVRPWAPPLIQVGERSLMAHRLENRGAQSVQIFAVSETESMVIGTVSPQEPFEIDGNSIALGPFKRYTGVHVYRRPQTPILILGCIISLAGLAWHYYHKLRATNPVRSDPVTHA
ncbi:MAG: cytochrome c biogenesis protein ResB [Pseudomonadales bacterium]|nr:cytochrome c biogenesis protein ResB [Pseudomonadales bacterium]